MFILIVVFLFARFINLDADRPFPIFAQGSDEFYKSSAAIYKINFGTWINDDENSGLMHAPLFPIFLYPVYKIMGVDLFSTRLWSVLGGILAVIFLYLILRKENKKIALFASFLLAINHVFFIINRVGLPETLTITMMLAGFYIISRNERRALNYAIAGFLMGIAFLLKVSLLYFMIAPLIFLIIQKVNKVITWKHFIYFALSGSVCLLIYFIYIQSIYFLIEPMVQITKAISLYYLFLPRLMTIFVNSIFGYPAIFLLSLVTVAYLVRKRFHFTFQGLLNYIKNINFTEKLAFSWFLGAIISVCLTSIMPRRIIPIVIPLVIYPALLMYGRTSPKIKEKNISLRFFDLIIPGLLILSMIINYIFYFDQSSFNRLVRVFVFKTVPSTSLIIQRLFNESLFVFISLFVMIFLLVALIWFFKLYQKSKRSKDLTQIIKFKRNLERGSLFSLISLLTLGFVKLSYTYFIQYAFKIPTIFLILISLVGSYFLYQIILKKPIKITKCVLSTYVIYCLGIIIIFSLIFPSFLLKEANHQIAELTDEGDYIIGKHAHGLSIESRTRPISYKFLPVFQNFINYSIIIFINFSIITFKINNTII